MVDNKGIELSLTLRDREATFYGRRSDNFSYTRNEIVDLNGETEINGRLICKEGYPINSWYLLETDGVFQNQSEIDNAQAVYGNRANLRPGYVKYVNQNNDNAIDGNDSVDRRQHDPRFAYAASTCNMRMEGLRRRSAVPGRRRRVGLPVGRTWPSASTTAQV